MNRRSLLVASALCAVTTAAHAQSTANPPPTGIAWSATATDIGVDTHLNDTSGFGNTNGEGLYANLDAVEAALSYLGLNAIRDGFPDNPTTNFNSFLEATALENLSLTANGAYHFTLVADDYTDGIAAEKTSIDQLFAGVGADNNSNPKLNGPAMQAGAVSTVEGLNEITNESPEPTLAQAEAWQVSIFCLTRQASFCPAISTDTNVAGSAVAEFTSNGPVATSSSPSSGFAADYMNAHPYAAPSNDYLQPLYEIQQATFSGDYEGVYPVDAFSEAGAGYTLPPGIETESGAYSEPQSATRTDLMYLNSYDDPTVAIKDLDTILNGVSTGTRTFIYQLFNNYPASVDSDNMYGLFRYAGLNSAGYPTSTPTPAATAIHDFYSIINAATVSTDTGTNCLPYTVSGLPAGAFTMMLKQPSTGGYAIVLWWDNPNDWDKNTHSEVAVTPANVTIDFATPVYGNVYDPIVSANPESGSGVPYGATSFSLQLGDHPVVLGLVSENPNYTTAACQAAQ